MASRYIIVALIPVTATALLWTEVLAILAVAQAAATVPSVLFLKVSLLLQGHEVCNVAYCYQLLAVVLELEGVAMFKGHRLVEHLDKELGLGNLSSPFCQIMILMVVFSQMRRQRAEILLFFNFPVQRKVR